MKPFYSDSSVTLFHGDMRDVLPTLGRFDCCVADPPYGETSLAWDRWPDGWPALVAEHTDGSTLVAARASGRRAVGVEASERYCEAIIRRLAQAELFAGDSA